MLGGLRKIKNLSFVPAFLWLFTQLVMSGILLPSAASADGSDSLFSGKILICTPAGLKYVSAASLNLEAGEGSSPPGGTSGNSLDCEWCLHFGNLGPLATPQYGLKLPPVTVVGKPFQAVSDITPRHTENWLFQGRAPPTLNTNS